MHALGLDIGSSTIKGAILELESGEIRDVIQVPFPSQIPNRPTGYYEVDADEVTALSKQIIERLANRSSPEAILFCGQHGGCVLTDANRKCVSPYVSWRDIRTSEPVNNDGARSVLQDCSDRMGDELRLSIGNELAPGGTVALLYWMKIRGLLPEAVTPLGIAEYVLLRLGGDRPVLEPTCAIGMMDFVTKDHPRSLYERLGLDQVRWPELREYRRKSGEFNVGDRIIPMYPVLGDHQAALLGANLGLRELSLNISTGSQVSLLSTQPELSLRQQTRCFFDGLLLNTITHLPAGRSLNALIDLLTEIPRAAGLVVEDPWKWINQLIELSPRTDLKTKLTFFPGPLGSRGEITNIGIDHFKVGELFRAAFENMANNYKEATSRLQAFGKFDRIAFSGGLVQKMPILRDEILVRFDTPSRTSEAVEETLGGLLRAARVVCGLADTTVSSSA